MSWWPWWTSVTRSSGTWMHKRSSECAAGLGGGSAPAEGPRSFLNFSPEVSGGPGSLPLAPRYPHPLGLGKRGVLLCPPRRKIISFPVWLPGPKKKMSIWSELWSKTKARWPRKKRNVFFSSNRTKPYPKILVLAPQTRKSDSLLI